MNCPDCARRTEVVKTMVMSDATERLRRCECGTRFFTIETIKRVLPSAEHPPTAATATAPQPPRNRPATKKLPATARQPAGNASAQPSDSDLGIPLPISEADQTRARAEQPVFQFDVAANDGKSWGLPPSRHAEYVAAFPSVDCMAEYRKISAWISSNPLNRKTPRGMPAFLFRWLGRAQDRGGSSPRLPVSAMPDPRCPFHRQPGTNNRPSRFPHANCPECKHVAAGRRDRVSEPSPPIVPASREELEALRRGNG